MSLCGTTANKLLYRQCPQPTGKKLFNLKTVFAQVHMLHEGGLYETDQTNVSLLMICRFIKSRADRDAV